MKRYARELSAALSALDQSRWRFELVQPAQRRWISRLLKHRQAERLESAVARYGLYPLDVRGRAADLFHVLDHGYGHLVRALDPDRTIVTCHDLMPLLSADRRIPIRVPANVVRTFRLRIREMGRAWRIITDSEATRDTLLEYTDIQASRIKVVLCGVNRIFQPREPDEVETTRLRLGVPIEAQVVLQVATGGRYKNTPGLLRAFARLRRKLGKRVVLIRIGAPLYEDEADLVSSLGLTDAIQYIGTVPSDSALAEWYRCAAVLAFPSLWEGFGWPPLEAMASGTPVVASRIPAIQEVVRQAAMLVDPENDQELALALERVLTDADEAARLRADGLARARELTWEETAKRTLAVYEEVA